MNTKTPRIEEMVEELEPLLKWPSNQEGNEAVRRLTKALTEANQAGMDETMEEAMAREKQLRDIHKVELDTISCMSLEQFVIWSDQRKQQKADTIKALQDKK